MAYTASKTRTWTDETPALGSFLEAEFDRIYENTDYNKAEVEKRIEITNIVDTFDSTAIDQPLSANAGNLLLARGFTRGRLHVYQSSPTIVRVPKWNLYEVSDKLIRVASELTLDFAALTNIYRNDGTTPIAASSEIQDKHLYLFMSDAGALSAMIVPDAEMDTGDHTYLANPELVKDSYTSKSIYDASKNAYYKNSKRIIATLRCNASNQIEFLYELGFGNRFMDVQELPVGGLFTEFRWLREHPGCFVGDASTITDMATDFPVLYQGELMSTEPLTFQKVWQIIQESDRQVKEAFRETDKKFRETDKKMQETDKRFKETDKKLRSLETLFTGQWGKLMESLVEGELVPLLNQRNIMVERTLQRVKGKGFEFDLIAENGHEVVIVEVKTTLRAKHIRHFLEKLSRLSEYLPRYAQNTVYGCVAYLRTESEAEISAIKNGLYLIRATGNSASITNSQDFQPANFGCIA